MTQSNFDPVGRLLSYVDRIFRYVENTTNVIAGLLIFALMCFGVVRILFRVLDYFHIPHPPLYGFIDIVEVSMVGFAVLSIAFVQRLGGHVRMELILTSLRGRWLWLAETFGGLVALFIVGILIPSSFSHFQRAFEYGDSTMDIEIVTWPAKLVVPFALTILFGRFLIQTVGYLRMLYQPNLEPIAIPVVQTLEDKARSEAASAEQQAR
ncbi:MAG: TRAP transporter small permease [Gammaproteobacteria bacterium]|nr:TRAP transporter small permease [Gammaproteobacteria bacterium]MYF37717.1 TRAP transporter small permease [Gammaproteobacteria bacterium]